MTIITRMIRLFKADIHGVMDQIEDQGRLIKQHLRDMEASLLQKETTLKKMVLTIEHAQQAFKKGQKECDNLEADLDVAIKKEKDDIARMLIKKLRPLTHIQSERSNHIEVLNREIAEFKENLDQQRLQYEQLKQKATEYFHRIKKQDRKNPWLSIPTEFRIHDLSAEEIELELLQRKEALKGGAAS